MASMSVHCATVVPPGEVSKRILVHHVPCTRHRSLRLHRQPAGSRVEALGEPVGCVARDPSRVGFGPTVTVHRADLLDQGSLRAIGEGYTSAYYLVHSMGRGGDANYEERDATAASNFARFASDSGIGRIVYLGGLGDRPTSQHLRSRLRVGEILRDQGPPLTWFRAGMVVGAGSESYRTLRSLVERLPFMLAPSWLDTPTQAIGIGDVLRYLLDAPGSQRPSTAKSKSGRRKSSPTARCSTDGRRARTPSPATDPGAGAHAVALVALDRADHTGRRGCGETVDRGARHRYDGHRPVRNGAV